jgi:amino acid permease
LSAIDNHVTSLSLTSLPTTLFAAAATVTTAVSTAIAATIAAAIAAGFWLIIVCETPRLPSLVCH